MGTGNMNRNASWNAGPRMALVAFGLLAAASAWAQVPGEKTVDGVIVRIGVAPAEQIMALPAGRAEHKMHTDHGGGPDHLVVALADARTGARIEKASVTVSISRMGMESGQQRLERMEAPGATSWGGYFDLRAAGPYLIHVVVTTPGNPAPIVAEFDYRNR